MKSKYSTIIWAIFAFILMGICAYEYYALSYNLKSEYDEGFFYITTLLADKTVVATQPLTLSQDFIRAVVPNIEQWDVLALRQIAFWGKFISILFLIVCSCVFLYKRYAEKRISIYLALISSYLLLATILLPSIVINMNDVILMFISWAFAFCLLHSVSKSEIVKFLLDILIGIVALFTLICGIPAGCMLLALCGLFLILDGGYSHKKCLTTIAGGIAGLLVGLVVMHFCIISLQDCYDFLLKGLSQTSGESGAAHHSLKKVILIIFFGLRDLTITTVLLCGITYVCMFIREKVGRDWPAILTAILLFGIVSIWQAKPHMTIAAVLCWLTIMLVVDLWKNKALDKKDLLLIVFSFLMPIGIAFGTNTHILVKAEAYCISWGLTIFYLYYRSRPEVLKYFALGVALVACCVFTSRDFTQAIQTKGSMQFNAVAPIARMHIDEHQKAFYEEVHGVLSDQGFLCGKDTLLGFCFNEMTIVAMDATPYTNDQQPEEFPLHDLNNVPCPKFIILSEWDSIVLYNHLTEQNWGFPEKYSYHKCINNPDPHATYRYTQSMIYCKQD